MPFDVFVMAAMRDELHGTVSGARVDKVIQTSEKSVAFQLWRPGWSGHLVMSAAGTDARTYLTDAKLAKAFETPTPFLMLLRKYCTGMRLDTIRQDHLERILHIDLVAPNRPKVTLIVEVMGNRSNLVVVDEDLRILGAIKFIGAHQSRIRQILPHHTYVPPPPQVRDKRFGPGPKLDPTSDSFRMDFQELLAHRSTQISVRDAVLGALQGCSPSVAIDIAARAEIDPKAILSAEMVTPVVEAVDAQYALIRSRTWTPVVLSKDERPFDFKSYETGREANRRRVVTMSSAVEEVSAGIESSDTLRGQRLRLHEETRRRLDRIESRLASLERSLASTTDAEQYRESGDLILGFQYGIQAGDSELVIPELDKRIELDRAKSPPENAERYFKRYRKARDASKRVPQLLDEARAEHDYVSELDLFIDLAETQSELTRLEADITPKRGGQRAKAKPPAVGKITSVNLEDGAQIIIGRSARQNEEVTFRLAGRGDLWLHARGVPGAHVVLRSPTGRADESDVLKAAALAAYYSKARHEGAADVIVSRVRDVHRFPGGAPGQVTVKNERTVRVRPAPASLSGGVQ